MTLTGASLGIDRVRWFAVEVRRTRIWAQAAGVVLLASLVGSCDREPTHQDRGAVPPAGQLEATAGQFRFDEGTHDVRTGITNNSSKPIKVTTATISWDGFQWETTKLPGEPVPPQQTAAFISRFGRANCATEPTEPRLIAVVNGVRRDLPLRLDDPGLFTRLRASACAGQHLADNAILTMSIGTRVVRRNGVPSYAGTVSVRRPSAPGEAVTVVDLGGSVLFDVLPREGRDFRPVRLAPDARSVSIPIRVGPTQRCDAHTRGNASQPFLFSVFTQLAGDPVHRTITVPDATTQRRLLGLLDRYCAHQSG